MADSTLPLVVRRVTPEAEGINSYELVDPQGRPLPSFEAGSHIDVHLPGGYVRQYSLCNSPAERHRYCIGVLKDPKTTGGSRAMHENVGEGHTLVVSQPRCHFRLVGSARRHLLLAGGIGVTPMMAMIESLHASGADFVMHYCTRSIEQTAFRERLAAPHFRTKVSNHYDGGDPSRGLDIKTLLSDFEPGTHLYYCGPTGFMRAVKEATTHWPSAAVHFEYFAPVPAVSPTESSGSFKVQLGRGGPLYEVPPDKSIVQVLREHGIEVETSCEGGVCGTCRTTYLEGTPVHNDFVLTEAEQKDSVLICCARSASEILVLGLPLTPGGKPAGAQE